MKPRLDPAALITGPAWAAYDYIRQNGICGFLKPLPGWRVEKLYTDSTIGDFSSEGTRTAKCYAPRPSLIDHFTPHPAVEHDRACHCGIRVCRDVYTLLQYVATCGWKAPEGNYAGLILERVLVSGSAAPARARTGRVNYPDGTIRATSIRLAEVFLPADLAHHADNIGTRYGVPVHTMPGDIFTFPGTPDTRAPEGWPEPLTEIRRRIQEADNGR